MTDRTPRLEVETRRPLLVVAFEGWNDAGEAASGAVARLREQLELVPRSSSSTPRTTSTTSSTGRPSRSTRTATALLEWPSVTPLRTGPDSVATRLAAWRCTCLLGTEPSRGWKALRRRARRRRARAPTSSAIVFLGAMLADVPHTRPISVFASSENAAVRDRLELERSTYEGPVGILSVLADAAERAGIPTLSIWASRAPLRAQRAVAQGDARPPRPARGAHRRSTSPRGDLRRRSPRRGRAAIDALAATTRTWPSTSAARAGARHGRLPRGERRGDRAGVRALPAPPRRPRRTRRAASATRRPGAGDADRVSSGCSTPDASAARSARRRAARGRSRTAGSCASRCSS